jgi:hypothetical protein
MPAPGVREAIKLLAVKSAFVELLPQEARRPLALAGRAAAHRDADPRLAMPARFQAEHELEAELRKQPLQVTRMRRNRIASSAAAVATCDL